METEIEKAQQTLYEDSRTAIRCIRCNSPMTEVFNGTEGPHYFECPRCFIAPGRHYFYPVWTTFTLHAQAVAPTTLKNMIVIRDYKHRCVMLQEYDDRSHEVTFSLRPTKPNKLVAVVFSRWLGIESIVPKHDGDPEYPEQTLEIPKMIAKTLL